MSVFESNYRHLWEVLIFCFNSNKTAAKAYRMLSSTNGVAALGEKMCREWFQCSKSSDFNFEYQHGGEKRKFSEILN